jgi:hypothetical protein
MRHGAAVVLAATIMAVVAKAAEAAEVAVQEVLVALPVVP